MIILIGNIISLLICLILVILMGFIKKQYFMGNKLSRRLFISLGIIGVLVNAVSLISNLL